MDVGQLEAFDRVVREGGFSRAAVAMGLAQPTISARIRTLEAAVGGALFDRRGRRIALTERGEAFLPYARRVLQLLDEGIEAARLTVEGARGRVTVGAIESLSGTLLARAIARFRAGHPEVTLYVRAQHTREIVRMLHDGVVGLGLLTWPLLDAELVPLLRFREPLLLVARADHPLAGAGARPLAEFSTAGPPLVAVRWGPQADRLLARLEEMSAAELPIETAREMVVAGDAIAFLTRTLVDGALETGRLVALEVSDVGPLHRESALVRRRQVEPTAAALAFARAIERAAGALCVESALSEY